MAISMAVSVSADGDSERIDLSEKATELAIPRATSG
jgi:hypothetical protein